MNTNIKKYLLPILYLFIIATTFVSCEDKILGSKDETYLTIYPSDIVITYPIDTVELKARVVNKSGKNIEDVKIKWEVVDNTVAKIVDGNKLVAVDKAQGKKTILKASLENGAVSTTNVTVRKLTISGITVFNPIVGTKEVKKNDKTEIEPTLTLELLDKVDIFVSVNTPRDFIFVADPASIIYQEKFTFPNLDTSSYKIEEVENKDLDPKLVKLIPKGGKWFKITALKEVKGDIEIAIANISSKISIMSGPVVQSMGLNKEMNEYEGNGVMDINKQDSVKFFIDISPADDEAIQKVFDDAKWTIDGGIARIIKKGFEKTKKDSKLFFYAIVESYEDKGSLSVSLKTQKFTARKSIKVEDIKSLKVNSVSITPATITDLLVGEIKSLRVKIDPSVNYAFLTKEFAWTVQNPELAVVERNDLGAFFVKGLKSGETDITLRVRDKESTIHLIIKPKPKSTLINNDTPVTLMLGDTIEWSANVVMEGRDLPDYKLLSWHEITEDKKTGKKWNPLTSIKPKTGKKTKITAIKFPDGNYTSFTTTIGVEFRGQTATRDLKIFPVQSNVDLQADDINLEEAGVTTQNGEISILLNVKKGVEKANITINVKTASNLSKVQAGEYNASSDKINVIWKSGLEKIATTGTLNITNTGSKKFSVKADLVLKVGDKNVTVKVDAQNLEEYYN